MSTDHPHPNVTSRPFLNDDDFWRVRDLLNETYPHTPTGFNWEVRRWDGWRFHNADLAWNSDWEKQVRLWETDDKKVVGAVFPEGKSDAQLQLHPDFRHIEEEMLVWAEANLGKRNDGGRRQLSIYVFEYDAPRRLLLEKRGYEKQTSGGVMRRLRFGPKQFPTVSLANGYTLRTTDPADPTDCRQIADLLNVAFGRDFHTAAEYHNFTTKAPCFRADLDLVAVAPDGLFAAYVGVPYNETHNYGIFEPVCTHPDHLRKGLARTLMLEGLHRLQEMGASDVYVGTGDQVAANKLYDALGFTEAYKEHEWRKVL